MKHVIAASLGLSLLAASALADEPQEDHFGPLLFLVDSCWQGTFPDGETVDTHCYEDVFGDVYIRDRHLVRGNNPDYKGETLYYWNKEASQLEFHYWNSLGILTSGFAEPGANGDIILPETYTDPDGTVRTLRTLLRRLGTRSYLTITEEKINGEWVESWRIEFKQIPTEVFWEQ